MLLGYLCAHQEITLFILNILKRRTLTGETNIQSEILISNHFTIFISDIGPIDLMSMLTLTWVVLPKEKLFSLLSSEFILRQYHLCRKVSLSYHNLLANLQECSLYSEEKLERVLLEINSDFILYCFWYLGLSPKQLLRSGTKGFPMHCERNYGQYSSGFPPCSLPWTVIHLVSDD